MNKKLTFTEIKKYIESYNYTLLSKEYINNKTKLLVKCDKGHPEYEVSFLKFKQGRRCPYCSNHVKITYENVLDFVNSLNYTLLSNKDQYKTVNSKLKIKCNKGHITDTLTYENMKHKGNRCKICANNVKYTMDYVSNYISKFGYKMISNEYKNSKSKILLKCKNDHSWECTFDNFISGERCPFCQNKDPLTDSRIQNFVELNGYKLNNVERDRYVNINVLCQNDHSYKVRWDNFRNGQRCPICNNYSSLGETEITRILNKYNILFIKQYKIEDCKFYKPLPFDFYLPDYNMIIEYDGIQHFEIVKHFGGYEGFIDRKIRDSIKNIYCKNNSIKLIRIPYTEYNNLENIISKNIKIAINE